MIHPADFHSDELLPGAGDAVMLRHRLFLSDLEKGVILRARVRGLLLPRQGDQPAAAEAYTEFAASPPPLTT
jgi:hypothetical protein